MAEPTVDPREARLQKEEADFARLVHSGARMAGDRSGPDYRRLVRPALWFLVAALIPIGILAGTLYGIGHEPGNHDYVGRGVVPIFFAIVGAGTGGTLAAFGGLALFLTRPKR